MLSVQMQAASFAADKKLEIFSYWTSGGEAAALDALFQATKRADPGIEIFDATIAGGGGSAVRPVLQARLAGGNPPDSWHVHPGSRDAQEAFNALKGSIPSRTDIDKSKFGPYHNWSMNSFAKDKLLPSCVHGAAAPAGFRQAF